MVARISYRFLQWKIHTAESFLQTTGWYWKCIVSNNTWHQWLNICKLYQIDDIINNHLAQMNEKYGLLFKHVIGMWMEQRRCHLNMQFVLQKKWHLHDLLKMAFDDYSGSICHFMKVIPLCRPLMLRKNDEMSIRNWITRSVLQMPFICHLSWHTMKRTLAPNVSPNLVTWKKWMIHIMWLYHFITFKVGN